MSEGLTLDESSFAALMAGLGPFETAPGLAIAVSGGADSLALCLLADRWARARGGTVTALTVNHGLRPEASDEAGQVGAWLAAYGVDHRILTVKDPAPQADVQNWARQQRYALLQDWCRAAGVLHLLLAHHRDDQAETVLLRLGRGSGVSGLSGMAAVTATADCRILRPLLTVPKTCLEAVLRSVGQAWVSDPSNESVDYARGRMRKLLPDLYREGLESRRLSETARTLARTRDVIDGLAADLVAGTVSVHPAGIGCINQPERWRTAPEDVSLRALAGVLSCLGGQEYPPRADRLERALAGWGRDMTLGGCRIVPEKGRIWIWREARSLVGLSLQEREDVWWDRRFRVSWPRASRESDTRRQLTVRALGVDGVAVLRRDAPQQIGGLTLPRRSFPALPSLWSDRMLVSVPHLGYSIMQKFEGCPAFAGPIFRFAPSQPVCPAGLIRRVGRVVAGS